VFAGLFILGDVMRFVSSVVLAGSVVLCASPVWAKSDVEAAGDVLQLLVPAVGYGMTFHKDDPEGRTQFYKSAATTFAVTHGLKRTIDAERPDGGSQSFPSGHTSAAFQGAGFIHARYGIASAWPAYVAATFVAYSRVDSDRHYTRDVIAGAAIGVASSFYFSPQQFGSKQSVVMPFVGQKQVGVFWMKSID
jgi:membrane-associated phospholipid phosphatase